VGIEQIPAAVAAVAIAYLLGCVTAGWYVVRWRTGRDLRTIGSGRLGGRNTARVVGLGWAAPAAAVDVAKGCLAVIVAARLAPELVGAAMVAVVAGHIWPVQLAFRGGRGIAPGIGAVAMAAPIVAFAVGGLFLVLSLVARSTLVPVVVAALAAPAVAIVAGSPAGVVLGTAGVGLLVVAAHRERLRERAEGRLASAGDSGSTR
jgi:acyl phosphate:glycerol-3-phosphate acyltransferase